MTTQEWIKLAQDKLKDATISTFRFDNTKAIDEVRKILNEIEELVKEVE